MTDKNLATKKLSYMADALKELDEALELYEKGDSNKKYYYYAAQKKSEEIVEAAISVNQLILLDKLDKQSENYYSSFTDLEPLGVFTKAEIEKLAPTAGFRNRLAHEYVNLDPAITLKSMEVVLKLYPKYIKKVIEYID